MHEAFADEEVVKMGVDGDATEAGGVVLVWWEDGEVELVL